MLRVHDGYVVMRRSTVLLAPKLTWAKHVLMLLSEGSAAVYALRLVSTMSN